MVGKTEEPDSVDTDSSVSTKKPDADRKKAARIATVVAIPVTLLTAVGAFWLIGANLPDPADAEEPVTMSSDPVNIDIPDLSADDAVTCRALIATLPTTLGDLAARVVTGEPGTAEVSAAYGDPAVTIRCGTDAVTVASDATVYPMPPTCWFAEETPDSVVWTSIDRELPVQVTVPNDHEESGQLIQAITKLVGEKIPVASEVPNGCLA